MSEARYLHARAVIDRQIRKWGSRALLRRASGDRECWASEAQLTASERNAMKNPLHKVYDISAVDLTIPPAKEDSLVLFVQPGGTVELPPLRFRASPEPFAPGGIVVYWEVQVE